MGEIVLIILGVLFAVYLLTIILYPLYTKFGFCKWFYHDVMGWCYPSDESYFNGVSECSKCRFCGRDIMQDSQGNWF